MVTMTTGRRRRLQRAGRRTLRPRWYMVVPACVLPAAGLVWFLLLGEEGRGEMLEALPGGAGQRALHAVAAFGVLATLAWLFLPVAHGGEVLFRRTQGWSGDRRGALCGLLLPVELLSYLFRLVFQGLFWLVVLGVFSAFLLSLVFIVWIVRPEFLGGADPILDLIRRVAIG